MNDWNSTKFSAINYNNKMTQNSQIELLRQEIFDLRKLLYEKEKNLQKLISLPSSGFDSSDLSSKEISRYSRQMLLPQIGISGQIALKKSKVLIVGMGGLGCPSSLYLAACGVGEITIVDYDEVELTNLHRQILHSESNLGMNKVDSGFDALNRINSETRIIPLHMHLDGDSLTQLLKNKKYDVVLDCTDNVPTRYLLNDLCVFNNIPLVSGAAIQMEGQLTVYNYKDGPCYRCLFPEPPPPETVTSCGDGGVLGVVPGIIGILQALEAIKIIINLPGVIGSQLILFDGEDTTFRKIRLRNRNSNCKVCGDNPTIIKPIDYEQFCNAKAHDKVENINILGSSETIDVRDLFKKDKDNLIIDVRPTLEYQLCSLPNSINIPYVSIEKGQNLEFLKSTITDRIGYGTSNVYVLCRRGNDSQRAVCRLKEMFAEDSINFINITGGLHAYSKFVDSTFPIY